MSAFSAVAMVGSDTTKIRVATPEMNCPMIALARSSLSVRVGIRWERARPSARSEIALGVGEQAVEGGRQLDGPADDAGAVALQPVAVGRMAPPGHDDHEVLRLGGDGPRVQGEALADHLARVDLDPRRTSGATQRLG